MMSVYFRINALWKANKHIPMSANMFMQLIIN